MTHVSFGRRAGALPAPRTSANKSAKIPAAAPVQAFIEQPAPAAEYLPSQDRELEEWKKARKFQIPWRPLSWMASLSFGIASFVLPDSVNDKVQWLLYALMAASFCAGFAKRRKKAAA
jgi:hypothetical protein